MRLTILLKQQPSVGSLHRLKVEETLKAAETVAGARLMIFGDVVPPPSQLPVVKISTQGGPLQTALLLRSELSTNELVHCLDVEAAFDLLVSRVDVRIILDPQALPSLRYQDETETVEHSVLKHLIEREERVMRRCTAVIYGNLYTRKLLGVRAVVDAQLRLRKEVIVAPRATLTHQSLGQIIYHHERMEDARVVYEALQRLKVPWRVSVMVDDDTARSFWNRDKRVRVIEHDKEWQAHLECSMVALCGGATSVGASSGLSLPRLALWAAHFGVTLVGTENALWRMLLSGAGLVPCDRPDLLAEMLTLLIEDEHARCVQHQGVVGYYEKNVQDIEPNFLPNLWGELGP